MGQDGRAELAARIRELRGDKSQAALAAAILHDRTAISRAETDTEVPSPALCEKLDAYYRTGGELGRRRQTLVGGQLTEVSPTDRRDLLAGLVASAGELTVRIRTGRTTPGRSDLLLLQHTIRTVTDTYGATPHSALTPVVGRHWRLAEGIVADAWKSDRLRPAFRVAAGQLAYLLCRLFFNTGDTAGSATFLELAEEHAVGTGDPALSSAVTGMWSTLHFYAGDYREAAAVAVDGRRWGYSYDTAVLAAYEARALGALGDDTGAMRALELMERSPIPSAPEPSCEPYGTAWGMLIAGGTLARLGRHEEALPITAGSVAAYDTRSDAPYEMHANALLAHSRALLGADIAAAADTVSRALDMVADRPTYSVWARAGELASVMAPHRSVQAVAELRGRLREAPAMLALTAGQMS
ncbi:helix-turn-helix transcriptional regulator [Pseudofrankia sp. BMG5.36]|uniref:helix-turn-helix domain-containing protein n=1 Tax=Pseudofrankia sp. BMG5.36 TaxID=1834512 RepID=UPI0008DA4CF8|nr:helix-turn-helix transcriptional regulator [Pseudofrankia sp. BMG5.36]OHV65328.1 hypothetical protein BCD48_04365 [Pseudofrankia sp. BMG5.36]